MIRNNRGLSLVEVLMSMAVLTILLMGVMELNKNNTDSSVRSESGTEYIQLVSEFLFLLNRDESCTAGLVDPSGVDQLTFHADLIKVNEANGIEISLYTPQTASLERSRLVFSQGQKYGKIFIDNVLIYLPDHTSGGDFTSASTISIQAEVVLKGRKLIATNQYSSINPIRKMILINIQSDATGESRVVGCGEIGAP